MKVIKIEETCPNCENKFVLGVQENVVLNTIFCPICSEEIDIEGEQ